MKYRKEFNPIDFPILFSEPSYIEKSAWWGHIPITKLLISLILPKIFVELGTHNGVSYINFCEAATSVNLKSTFYAIDHWKGDGQAGFYGKNILEKLKNYHDPKFGKFSKLIQKTFDDALVDFSEKSIDLLHIDGHHSYDSVRHDYDSWLPKMKKGGIILFHDINVYKEGFGVFKLWDELIVQNKSFSFSHSHGLGILAIDNFYPKEMDMFFEADPVQVKKIQNYFQYIGRKLEKNMKLRIDGKIFNRLKFEIARLKKKFKI